MCFGQQQDTRDVVLLGAGFSNAVSSEFPLTPKLGQLARKQLALDKAGVPESLRFKEGTNFESWLSQIGEDQPYCSVEENLAARSLFVRMSKAIASVIRDQQNLALREESPVWLDDLISVLHVRQATVINFNYDNVIECAVDGHCLTDRTGGGIGRPVTSHDIVDRLPPLPSGWTPDDQFKDLPASLRRDPHQVARSLRLLKLHGSLSWYWSPDDETGVTLQRWWVPPTFGVPPPDDEEARQRALPGRVPFIVPPTAIKSSYLTNLVVREIWGRARTALAEAKRLIVIGYSVPPEDQVVSGMLTETLAGKDVKIFIVDPCSTKIEDRLKHLGITSGESLHFHGRLCVEEFAKWYRNEQAEAVVKSLRDRSLRDWSDADLQGQVSVDWGKCGSGNCQASAAGIGHHRYPDLKSIKGTAGEEEIRVPLVDLVKEREEEIDQTQVPTLLRLLSDNPQVRRLVVCDKSGRDFPIVDYTISQPTSIDPSNHLTLVPSGHPRR
ncbi:MAG: hypothetical protein M1483_05555 [Actinobacteria bacterium]|nr:hypothetical protein [Actinomycetota bacterium]MCL6105077.1 hypothetical protein [Actinomycetota bacterium]